MPNLLPLQPRFNLFVSKPRGKQEYELTNYVDSVSLEVDQNQIATLTFNVRDPELHLEYLQKFYKIDFYGGYLTNTNYYSEIDASKGQFSFLNPSSSINSFFRYLFSGQVRSIRMEYKEDGTKSLQVEAVDSSWGATPSQYKDYYAYPSKDCSRKWAAKETMSLTDIIKGLVEIEMGLISEVTLGGADHEYTVKRPLVQDGISDWALLRKLAKNNNCWLSTVIEGEGYKVNFIDKSTALNTVARTEFVWLDRQIGMPYDFKDGDYFPINTSITDERQRLKDNQIALISVSVEETPSLDINGTQAVKITEFNQKTGMEEEKLVSYDETKDELIYYELDRAKVDFMVRNNPKEADRLTNMGPFGIPPDDFKKYYKEVRIPKGTINAIDRPLQGINVTATILGNVLVEPFQSYAIHGISRYSTLKRGKKGRYYLQGLTHTWDSNGFMTELRFIS